MSPRIWGAGGRAGPAGGSGLRLTAYALGGAVREGAIAHASPDRAWMGSGDGAFANRCLPLRIANQAGWLLRNEQLFEAVWNGGPRPEDTVLRPCAGDWGGLPPEAVSHFGVGVVTWPVPYLFRTPPGWDLFVRGPTNWCKDGACALDAIVETGWAVATFTMNWKLTRPGLAVRFDAGEPICMVCPIPVGALEAFRPEIHDLRDNPDLARRHREWAESRQFFNRALRNSGSPLWQKDYYLGRDRGGRQADGHRTKLNVSAFQDRRRSAKGQG